MASLSRQCGRASRHWPQHEPRSLLGLSAFGCYGCPFDCECVVSGLMQCAAVCQQDVWSQVLAYCVLPVSVTSCGDVNKHTCMQSASSLSCMHCHCTVMLVRSLLLTSSCHATLQGGSALLGPLAKPAVRVWRINRAWHIKGNDQSVKRLRDLLAAGLSCKVCKCRSMQHEC